MHSWLPKKKLITISFVATFLALLAYGAGVLLVNRKIGQIERAFTETESAVAQEERARALKSVADRYESEITTLRGFFVVAGDEVDFIERIESVARESGVDFEIDSISQPQAKPDPKAIKEDLHLRINLEGSWGEIVSFLNELERMPFGATIQNIDLNSRGKGAWSGFVEFLVFRAK